MPTGSARFLWDPQRSLLPGESDDPGQHELPEDLVTPDGLREPGQVIAGHKAPLGGPSARRRSPAVRTAFGRAARGPVPSARAPVAVGRWPVDAPRSILSCAEPPARKVHGQAVQ